VLHRESRYIARSGKCENPSDPEQKEPFTLPDKPASPSEQEILLEL